MGRARGFSKSALTAAVGWAFLATPLAAQAFEVDDIQVCPGRSYVLDMEFDPASRTIAYIDNLQQLKVMPLKRDGMPLLANCKGTVIDQNALVTVFDVGLVNGPEWGRSQLGAELYYSKLGADGQPAMARAWQVDGVWQTEFLASGNSRAVPVASLDDDDPQPRLMYVGNPGPDQYVALWRESNDPATEKTFPGVANRVTASGPRWVKGQRAITTSALDANGIYQAAVYDIDQRTTTVLTSGPGNKGEVWMWPAPEFGGDNVFITVTDNCCLSMYRQVGGSWVLLQTLDAADFADQSGIFSPEPYVYEGRSYILMLTSPIDRRLGKADIWITSLDPAQPLLRQLTDPAQKAVRIEPEWVSTPTGLYVYYTQYDARRLPSLRRAAAGF
jgi:hypothetical protein